MQPETRGRAATLADIQEELRVVLVSRAFRQSPRLSRLLQYLCNKTISGETGRVSEYTIAVDVFEKPPDFRESKDAIVRVEMHRLRKQLGRYYAEEGSAHHLKIVVPIGKYAPEFQVQEPVLETADPELEGGDDPPAGLSLERPRTRVPVEPSPPEPPQPRRRGRRRYYLAAAAVVLAGVVAWTWPRVGRGRESGAMPPQEDLAAIPPNGEVRILAGSTGGAYVDAAGHLWQPDQYYQGGLVMPGPKTIVPPPPDPRLFQTMREGPVSSELPEEQRLFSYNIPLKQGVYELRLYFADPLNENPLLGKGQDGQNLRRFAVRANGRSLLQAFDAVADAGWSACDIRAFKDITPAEDGKLHLEFVPSPSRPFVNAIELVPSRAGRISPIRIAARETPWTDAQGTRWEPDNFFIRGRRARHSRSQGAADLPELYGEERYGNFGYAIPVPPGSYTVNLHFAETFFAPAAASTVCRGPGCRVFDVTCNGSVLLRDLDVFQSAGGAFRPLVRTFRGVQPNGQGKLLLSFSPSVNYAEVRAIEVLDEGL